jgi:hypothetical protein
MNDEQMQSLLEEGFRAMNTTPEDVERSTREVLQRKAHVRQKCRWRPFPVFYRRTQSPTTNGTTQHQPSPIPAKNGHSPTVLGKTQSMFSPVKAITAGALVFAIGGVMLIAQPFDQQGSVPGAETEAVAPTWATATVQYGSNCDFGDTNIEDGVTQERGMNCQGQTWTSDDPRLDGKALVAANADSFDVDGQGYSLVTSVVEFSNDAGGWQCTNADRVVSPADTLFQTSRFDGDRLSCIGDGDYEGLSAILVADHRSSPMTVEGLVFPGEMPPMPEFPSAE